MLVTDKPRKFGSHGSSAIGSSAIGSSVRRLIQRNLKCNPAVDWPLATNSTCMRNLFKGFYVWSKSGLNKLESRVPTGWA